MSWIQTLSDIMNKEQILFTLYDKPIAYEEAFTETGLLPALIQRANQMCLLSLGYGLGASFVDNQDSILGVEVQFDEVTPDVLRLLYVYDVILELVRVAPSKEKVALDELLYD